MCHVMVIPFQTQYLWWRHQMEIFSALLAFVRGIHRSPVNSPHKGQWRGAFMFSLIRAWINGWVNNGEAGDFRRHRAHYDVIVVYDKMCTHCYALFCADCIINLAIIEPVSHWVALLAMGQSGACSSARKTALRNVGKINGYLHTNNIQHSANCTLNSWCVLYVFSQSESTVHN